MAIIEHDKQYAEATKIIEVDDFGNLNNITSYNVAFLRKEKQGFLYKLVDQPTEFIKIYCDTQNGYTPLFEWQKRTNQIANEFYGRKITLDNHILGEERLKLLTLFYKENLPSKSGMCIIEGVDPDKNGKKIFYPFHILHLFSSMREIGELISTNYLEKDIEKISDEMQYNLALQLLDIYSNYCMPNYTGKAIVHCDLFGDNILIIGDPQKDPNSKITIINWAGAGLWDNLQGNWVHEFSNLTYGKEKCDNYPYPFEYESLFLQGNLPQNIGPYTDYWFLTVNVFMLLIKRSPFFMLPILSFAEVTRFIDMIHASHITQEWPPSFDDYSKIRALWTESGNQFDPNLKDDKVRNILEKGRSLIDKYFGSESLKILYSIFFQGYKDFQHRLSPTVLLNHLENKIESYHGDQIQHLCCEVLKSLENQLKIPIPLLRVDSASFGYVNEKNYITRLNLPGCNLSEIPSDLFTLKKLKSLSLHLNSIKKIPNEIKELKELEYLSLSDNNLESLNDSIMFLTELKELDFSNTNLAQLSSAFTNLIKLTRLNLSFNRFEDIPKELIHLQSLEELNLAHNFITKVDSQFLNLVKLKKVNLSYNLIKKLPDDIAQLLNRTEFQILNLTWNYIIEFPPFVKTSNKILI